MKCEKLSYTSYEIHIESMRSQATRDCTARQVQSGVTRHSSYGKLRVTRHIMCHTSRNVIYIPLCDVHPGMCLMSRDVSNVTLCVIRHVKCHTSRYVLSHVFSPLYPAFFAFFSDVNIYISANVPALRRRLRLREEA